MTLIQSMLSDKIYFVLEERKDKISDYLPNLNKFKEKCDKIHLKTLSTTSVFSLSSELCASVRSRGLVATLAFTGLPRKARFNRSPMR